MKSEINPGALVSGHLTNAVRPELGDQDMIRSKNNWKAYLYLFPAMLVIAVFVIYPMFRSVYMSFFENYNIFKHTGDGFGFKNYIAVLNDSKFYLSVINTFKFTIVVVPVSIAISLVIAALLNSGIKGWKVFQNLFFVPYVTNLMAIGLAFRVILHSEYGVLNYLLSFAGVAPVAWLNDADYALVSLMIFGIWSGLAFKIVVFLAGISNIDKTYYEAAQVDGANPVQMFFRVTVPQLMPVITYISIVSVIGSLKTYIEVIGLFGTGGPAGSASTIVYYVYDQFYNANKYPKAAAAAVLLFIMILMMTFVQNKLINRNRDY